MFSKIEAVFNIILQYSVLLIEFIGVGILLWAIIKAFISLITKKKSVRLELAEGIALSLEFKIGGELLRTVLVRELNELLILGCVILLRAALTFLIQWEIRNERKTNIANVEKTEEK